MDTAHDGLIIMSVVAPDDLSLSVVHSAGVFFNDSTKIIAEPEGENVKYIDRGR